MSDTPDLDIHHQAAFGDDGELEVSESSVETSLEDFGADVDHRERESRLDRPEATEFGVDNRPAVTRSTEAHEDEQASLFPDTDADQQTLTGEAAAMRCLFGE